jgi:hypothetical protein
VICPKCGHKQEEFFAECYNCGVIFSKATEHKAKKTYFKKRFQKLSDKEIEQFALSQSGTLEPGVLAIVKEEIRRRNLSGDRIAAVNLKTKAIEKSTSGLFNKTLKIMLVTLLPLLLFILIVAYPYYACKKPPGCTLWGEFKVEHFGLTYERFKHTKYAPQINIPESSENIDFFRFGVRDCGKAAIQARVKGGFLDLYAIVSDYALNSDTHPTIVENVRSPMVALATFFGGCGDPQPEWFQADDPMQGFNAKVLKYDHGGSRGRGIWAFYNEKTQILRVFSFQGQHLDRDDFERELNPSNSDMSKGLYPHHPKSFG